jgi:hypothetical protein
MKWKKQSTGWPPDDPPKGNGTTFKGIETFGEREKKNFQDSLSLYNTSKWNAFTENERDPTHLRKISYIPYKNMPNLNGVLANFEIGDMSYPYGSIPTLFEDGKVTATNSEHLISNQEKYNALMGMQINNKEDFWKLINKNIRPIGYDVYQSIFDDGRIYNQYSLKYKKPTGNGLQPQLSKVPIIKPELQSSLIKFRPTTPLPKGNQDLPFGNYTQIGMKIKPDGTKFIYDRLGRTDKTVVISDPRIGSEYYIDDLFKDVKKDTPIYKK